MIKIYFSCEDEEKQREIAYELAKDLQLEGVLDATVEFCLPLLREDPRQLLLFTDTREPYDHSSCG